jgi:class 3 adenylate cyclase
MAYLRREDDSSVRFQLVEPEVTVGRDPTSDISLVADLRVSRQQATIRYDNEQWVIFDHESANGTYVNGRRISEHPLRDGDRIRLGKSTFIFVPIADPNATITDHDLTSPTSRSKRSLATVMFTDIVGSTNQLSQVGDSEWRIVLEQHDAIINLEVERFQGVKIQSTGDGALLTFDAPIRAIQCAAAICTAVRPIGIEIRAGIHTGEVELRERDIAGIAVHVASRVAARAGPNEILVSRTVVDLAIGTGFQFDDRGEHELKGVPGTWRLFAVRQ